MCTKNLRENILGKVGDAAQRSPLPTYFLDTTTPEEIGVGSFYEINHSKLPPTSPTQLQLIRVVMVSAKTKLNVTVRYPSAQSLEAYFSSLPVMDEKYVMGPKLAIEVLGRQIPSEEFDELRHSKSFWVSSFRMPDSMVSKAGSCFSKLQSSRIKSWGSQRVVAYVQDSTKLNSPKEAISQIKVKEEEKENQMTEYKEVQNFRKRKLSRPTSTVNKKMKRGPKAKPVEQKTIIHEHKEGTYVDRWPLKRYEAAAKKLLEVLKANDAVYGNPISRFQLRAEARSQIGDTGLLDHLLKHLAGEVVPGGSERLRRRCDAEGKMEYWLENADLAEIRKQAGVQDPYWTPPPGWKPGDCLSSHNCISCQEVSQLKEELSSMRRQIVELESKNEDERANIVALSECATFSGRLNSSNPKEMYASLLKKKSIMEDQLLEISKALMGLEENMKMLSHKAETAAADHGQILKREEINEIHMTGIEDNLGKGSGEFSGVEGELGESQERAKRLSAMKMKLKPCEHQDDIDNITISQASHGCHHQPPLFQPPLHSLIN